jgi:hypothetical protein
MATTMVPCRRATTKMPLKERVTHVSPFLDITKDVTLIPDTVVRLFLHFILAPLQSLLLSMHLL